MSGMNPQAMMQLMQMMKMQQQDPFSRSMPGEGLLGQGAMSPPQDPMQMQNGAGGQMLDPQGMQNADAQAQQIDPNAQMSEPMPATGLPNLPQSFAGFGYGANAPKETQPTGLRQQLIQALMAQMANGGMQGGF